MASVNVRCVTPAGAARVKKSKRRHQVQANAAASPLAGPSHHRSRLWWPLGILAVIVLTFQVYGPSLRGPFVFDDFSLPFYNVRFAVDRLSAWVTGVRPVLMLSYWTTFRLVGRNPYWYHFANLLIHVTNALLVYVIASRLLDRVQLRPKMTQAVAIFCGLLFLLHPLQTESVAYIAGRSESLSALFFLAAFAVFISNRAETISWGRSALVLVFFALAVGTKEHMAILPAVFVLTDWFWHRDDPMKAIRRNIRVYLPILLAAPVALFAVWKVLLTSTSAGFHLRGVTWYSYFLTECGVLLTYLRLFLFPVVQNADYNVPIVTVPGLRTVVGIVTLAGLLVVSWRWRDRKPLVAFGILLFLVVLAPTSSFIPIKDVIAERRMYLPLMGLVLASVGLLLEWDMSREQMVAFGAAVLIAAGFLTYQRSRVWGSEVALWEDTLAKSPDNLRGYPHLIHGYVTERRCNEALQRLDGLSTKIPIDATLLVHWAFAYECVNRPDEALRKLERAAELAPDANIEMKIAGDSLRLNQIGEAMTALSRALQFDPSLDSAYVTRGDLYTQTGQIARAIEDYRRALQVNPKNEGARNRLNSLRNP